MPSPSLFGTLITVVHFWNFLTKIFALHLRHSDAFGTSLTTVRRWFEKSEKMHCAW